MALNIYQTPFMVLGTTEVVSIPEPPAPSGTYHIHYISGSAVRQGSIVVGTSSPLSVAKIQKLARLQPVPEDRFNDITYYFS
jgi:hypothetical protein